MLVLLRLLLLRHLPVVSNVLLRLLRYGVLDVCREERLRLLTLELGLFLKREWSLDVFKTGLLKAVFLTLRFNVAFGRV